MGRRSPFNTPPPKKKSGCVEGVRHGEPPNPLILAPQRAGKRRSGASAPVCANTLITATPSRGCNYTVNTARVPARTEGMPAPTAHRQGPFSARPPRPPPVGCGPSAEPRGRRRRGITGMMTAGPRLPVPVPKARAGEARTSYRVSVEGCQRGPGGARRTAAWVQGGRRRLLLPEQRRVRLQSQLQVENVVDDMLQDLHFADPLVGRDGGHQLPQPAVTVIHIALQAQRRRLLARRRAPLAAAVLGQAPQGWVSPPAAAARHAGLCLAAGVPDGTHGFHAAAARREQTSLLYQRCCCCRLPRPRAAAHAPPATGAGHGRSLAGVYRRPPRQQ